MKRSRFLWPAFDLQCFLLVFDLGQGKIAHPTGLFFIVGVREAGEQQEPFPWSHDDKQVPALSRQPSSQAHLVWASGHDFAAQMSANDPKRTSHC
jgi:hypothetical protein